MFSLSCFGYVSMPSVIVGLSHIYHVIFVFASLGLPKSLSVRTVSPISINCVCRAFGAVNPCSCLLRFVSPLVMMPPLGRCVVPVTYFLHYLTGLRRVTFSFLVAFFAFCVCLSAFYVVSCVFVSVFQVVSYFTESQYFL